MTWLLITFACGCLPAKQHELRPALNAADFGLTNLVAGADATPVFRRAIEACRKNHSAGLTIPPGEWHLYPDYAFEQTLAVSNNDPGVKRVVLVLDGGGAFLNQ